ncbi:MAG: dihydropteroate synthase [Lentisphaeria bacterium]|nr:dihydropteroate synthase [Lentisphaeria bacterium]
MEFLNGKKPLLMGIVNATGDSFSEGALSSPDSAAERAFRLLEAGADWLDIGGESTRPGAAEIPAEEEIRRLSGPVRRILERSPETVVSVDTRHAETAEKMLELGAKVINDVSMLRFDPHMAEVLAAHPRSMLVLCHSRGTPADMRSATYLDYGADVVGTICDELLDAARRSGIGMERILFDPGFGFAKSVEQQLEMMRRADEFVRRLGNVLFGISRKSFIGAVTGESVPAERLGGTLAGELHLASCGAAVIRTHDVKMLRDALVLRAAVLDGEVR